MRPGELAVARGANPSIQLYNEAAFLFFIEIERRRALRLQCPLPMVLIDMSLEAGAAIEPRWAQMIFAALAASVRDTDVIGWHKSDLVAGALLAQGKGTFASDMIDRIRGRIGHALCDALPLEVGSRINVRVLDLQSTGRTSFQPS